MSQTNCSECDASFASDPVFEEAGSWYFWDEVWCNRLGPYDTEMQAREAVCAYAKSLG